MSKTSVNIPNHRHTEVVSSERLHYLKKAADNMGPHAVVSVIKGPGERYTTHAYDGEQQLGDGFYQVEVTSSFNSPQTGRSTDPLYDEVSRLKAEDESRAANTRKSA